MKLHPRLSRAAVELVSRFETFHPQARPASGGGWTIGYGHTLTARPGAHVTHADADALLLYDLSVAAEAVEAALFAPADPHQFEALSAFCFNIGVENFRASSALARFNAGAELEAADEIERWRNAELGAGTQVVDALVRRRAAEKAHFLGLAAGLSTSPRAVLRPVADGEVARVEPPPPPASAPAPEPGSATLAAAAGIQARLRELVPEPDPPPSPEQAEEAELEPPPHPEPASAWEASTPETSAELDPSLVSDPPDAPAVEPAPLAVDEPALAPVVDAAPLPFLPPSSDEPPAAVPPQPAPPPPAPARPSSPPLAPPAPLIDIAAPAEAAPAIPASAQVVRRSFRVTARSLFALLSALGACLFVAAAVVILGGRADLSSLLMGVVGAVTLALGVYGLLGPERRRDEAPPG